MSREATAAPDAPTTPSLRSTSSKRKPPSRSSSSFFRMIRRPPPKLSSPGRSRSGAFDDDDDAAAPEASLARTQTATGFFSRLRRRRKSRSPSPYDSRKKASKKKSKVAPEPPQEEEEDHEAKVVRDQIEAALRMQAYVRGHLSREETFKKEKPRGQTWEEVVNRSRAGRCTFCGLFFDIEVLGQHARECGNLDVGPRAGGRRSSVRKTSVSAESRKGSIAE